MIIVSLLLLTALVAGAALQADERLPTRQVPGVQLKESWSWGGGEEKVKLIRGALSGAIRAAWEQGVAQDAVLEFDYPDSSPFGANPFANPDGTVPASVLAYAAASVSHGNDKGQLAISATDTASQLDTCAPGAALVLGDGTDHFFLARIDWQNRTRLLRHFMFDQANRTSCGALSHRSDYLTYWNDGMYMLSGFLSALGIAAQDEEALHFAYDNLRIYRENLYRADYGLLGHIRNDLGTCGYPNATAGWQDNSTWATGNLWAIGGMTRTLNGIWRSSFNDSMQPQAANLTLWIDELLTNQAAYQIQGLLSNRPDASDSFGDSASSALWAWAVYRLAVLLPGTFAKHVEQAEKFRELVLADVSAIGELRSAVDVLNWHQPGIVSAEGQSFVLLMLAAWRDYCTHQS